MHPASRELVETKRKAWRFLWKHGRGEGWTLAAVELVGALGCSWSIVREREQRGIGTEGEIRESERVRGAAWRLQGVVEASREAGGGRSRRWPGRVAARAGRVPVLLAEEEGDREGGGGGLGRWRSWARQVSQVSGWASLFFLNFCSIFFI